MVGDPSSDEFIHWTPEGTSFVVTNQELFSQHVLPQYFKHSNFTSFIRQLNMYGFHKIPSIQHGSLVAESQVEQFEFAHDNFQRGKQDLLCFVIRRRAVHNEELVKEGSLDINSVLHEITAIKRHQMTISSDLQKMQRDNETIWSETVQLRERAAKQQDTIDKILRFLASIFSSSTKAPTLSAASKRRRIELPASLPVGSSGSEASFDANSGHANLNGVLPVQLPTPTPTSSALGQHSLHGISTPQQLQELHDQSQLPLSLASSSKQSQAQGLQAQHLLAGSTDLLAGPIFDLSAGSASSNPNPQLLDQLASSTNNIRASIQSAHEVAEDIDILQDRVNDIAAAVTSLAHQPDALHQWNVDDLIANAGDDDDHAALLALMSQQPELLKLAGNPTAAAAALAAGVPSAKPESAPNMLSSLPATVPISMPMTVHIPVSVPVTVPMPIAGGIAFTEAQQTAMTNGHSHDSEAIDDDYFDTFFSTS
nr:stress-responsive transcription factor hsf1 [Polyrhizophydium stewartii]